MFLGEYQYTIDGKGRVTIPPKFREAFRDGVILTRGFDKCMVAYPLPQWKLMADKMAGLPVTSSSVRALNRYTFSGAFGLDMDKQNRVLVPPALREYAQLKNDVVVIGLHTYLEIWAKELWDDEKAAMGESGWQIGESIEYPK